MSELVKKNGLWILGNVVIYKTVNKLKLLFEFAGNMKK
jgi:hypothetical protein